MIPLSNIRRILEHAEPILEGDPCRQTCYSPIRYTAANGRQMLMTQGGIIIPMTTLPNPHADQLYLSEFQPDGSWSAPAEMITWRQVPWMKDGGTRETYSAGYISAWTNGNVRPIGSKFVGVFCGCGSDPSCCTEASVNETPFGPCHPVPGFTQYPCFNAFMFISDNGVDGWKMVENPYGISEPDPMLRARFVGRTPKPDEFRLAPADGPTGYKGIDHCSIGPLLPDGYFYFTCDFWSSWGAKTLIMRTRIAIIGEQIFVDNPQIWNGGAWIAAVNGIIPDEFNEAPGILLPTKDAPNGPWTDNQQIFHGNAFGYPVGTIIEAPPGSPGKYAVPLLYTPRGTPNVEQHRAIAIAYSGDCVHWLPETQVGAGFTRQVLDPNLFLRSDGHLDVLWGATECPDGDGPYSGLGIYVGDTGPADLALVERRRAVL
jgi:hypothetical protein